MQSLNEGQMLYDEKRIGSRCRWPEHSHTVAFRTLSFTGKWTKLPVRA